MPLEQTGPWIAPAWVLITFAALVAALCALLMLAIFQGIKIECLRYCYWMLAHHTPAERRDRALAVHADLMRRAHVRPIHAGRSEPLPYPHSNLHD